MSEKVFPSAAVFGCRTPSLHICRVQVPRCERIALALKCVPRSSTAVWCPRPRLLSRKSNLSAATWWRWFSCSHGIHVLALPCGRCAHLLYSSCVPVPPRADLGMSICWPAMPCPLQAFIKLLMPQGCLSVALTRLLSHLLFSSANPCYLRHTCLHACHVPGATMCLHGHLCSHACRDPALCCGSLGSPSGTQTKSQLCRVVALTLLFA